MGQQARKADRWKAARPWLLAPLVIAGCATTDAKKPGDGFQAFGSSSANAEPSWTDKLTAPFKAGAATVAGTMDSRAATANDSDAISLSKKPNKKNPDLIVAVAQMHERAGKLDEAEKQYQRALKLQPKHLGALIGYAHLQDRRNKLAEATKLYQTAAAAHPKEAAAQNDLGLCYHRRGMLPEAQSSLAKAVKLEPDRKLYRNNLATVFVEQGQIDAALEQLATAHGQAAGHYNLGYLLAKKGDTTGALTHFQQAAALDPTLTAAHQWVAKLSPQISVAQHYPLTHPKPAPNGQSQTPPQTGGSRQYLQTNPPSGDYPTTDSNRWSSPPAAVRYPDQQTSVYAGEAAMPPTPDHVQ